MEQQQADMKQTIFVFTAIHHELKCELLCKYVRFKPEGLMFWDPNWTALA